MSYSTSGSISESPLYGSSLTKLRVSSSTKLLSEGLSSSELISITILEIGVCRLDIVGNNLGVERLGSFSAFCLNNLGVRETRSWSALFLGRPNIGYPDSDRDLLIERLGALRGRYREVVGFEVLDRIAVLYTKA